MYQNNIFCYSNWCRKNSCLKQAFKIKWTEKKGSGDSSFLPFSILWHFITIIHTLSTRNKENAKHCVNVILWLYLSYRHERPFRRDAQVDFYIKLLTAERRWRSKSKFKKKNLINFYKLSIWFLTLPAINNFGLVSTSLILTRQRMYFLY